MKRYLFLLFFGLLPFLSLSQGSDYSALYFDNGKLRADTSLTISADQLKVWRLAENNIAAWIGSKVNYPKVAERNGIEGLIIVAFDCQANEIKNIRVLKKQSSGFNEAGILAIQNASKDIITELSFWSNWSRKKLNYRGTYYIPIDFSMIPFKPELINKGAIPMIKISRGGIGYPDH